MPTCEFCKSTALEKSAGNPNIFFCNNCKNDCSSIEKFRKYNHNI